MTEEQRRLLSERLQGMGLIPINKCISKKKPKIQWRRRFWK